MRHSLLSRTAPDANREPFEARSAVTVPCRMGWENNPCAEYAPGLPFLSRCVAPGSGLPLSKAGGSSAPSNRPSISGGSLSRRRSTRPRSPTPPKGPAMARKRHPAGERTRTASQGAHCHTGRSSAGPARRGTATPKDQCEVIRKQLGLPQSGRVTVSQGWHAPAGKSGEFRRPPERRSRA